MYTSYSALKDFERCPLLWYLKRVLQVAQEEESPALKLGIQAHEQAEQLAKGQRAVNDPDTLEVTNRAWKLAGCPKEPTWKIEQKFSLPLPNGIYLRGKIDLYRDGILLDYKFSKDPEKWLPREEAIPNDRQLCLYAWAIQKMSGEWPTVIGQVQISTKNNYAEIISAPIDVPTARKVVSWAERLAHDMSLMVDAGVQKVPSCAQNPGTLSACNAYGRRCPAYDYCWALKNHPVRPHTAVVERNNIQQSDDRTAKDALRSLVDMLSGGAQ